MKSECPCKGCVPPMRRPGCHEMCLAYNAWRTKIKEETAAINEQKHIEYIGLDYHCKTIDKVKKYSGRKWNRG